MPAVGWALAACGIKCSVSPRDCEGRWPLWLLLYSMHTWTRKVGLCALLPGSGCNVRCLTASDKYIRHAGLSGGPVAHSRQKWHVGLSPCVSQNMAPTGPDRHFLHVWCASASAQALQTHKNQMSCPHQRRLRARLATAGAVSLLTKQDTWASHRAAVYVKARGRVRRGSYEIREVQGGKGGKVYRRCWVRVTIAARLAEASCVLP